MSRKNVYVAASSSPEGIAAYHEMVDILTARGHKITHNWTTKPKENRAAGITDVMMSRADRVKEARANLLGILRADIVVFLAPDYPTKSEGAAYELGFQHGFEAAQITIDISQRALFTTTIIVGPAACLFADLSEFHADSMTEAADIVDRLECAARAPDYKPFRCA